jgi:hypothetical protein
MEADEDVNITHQIIMACWCSCHVMSCHVASLVV